jgi:hypothetical protein
MPTTTQLRTYTIREGLLDEWARRWREDILPVRREFGFTIPHAFLDRERNQFIWMVSYTGPETFTERNRIYWNSPQRLAMNLDHKQYLVSSTVHILEDVI